MRSAGENRVELLAAREGGGGAGTLHSERRSGSRRDKRRRRRQPAMIERANQHARESIARAGTRETRHRCGCSRPPLADGTHAQGTALTVGAAPDLPSGVREPGEDQVR